MLIYGPAPDLADCLLTLIGIPLLERTLAPLALKLMPEGTVLIFMVRSEAALIDGPF